MLVSKLRVKKYKIDPKFDVESEMFTFQNISQLKITIPSYFSKSSYKIWIKKLKHNLTKNHSICITKFVINS